MNPIAKAVNVFRDEAVTRALTFMQEKINAVEIEYTGVTYSSMRPSTTDRQLYKEQESLRSFVRSVMNLENVIVDSGKPASTFTTINDSDVAALLLKVAIETASSFDAYVEKLISKIGDCDSAELTGHLWTHSVLTIVKGSNTEQWKTQMIINVSCLGKLFNQFPTRKMK